jgi:holin-like protein
MPAILAGIHAFCSELWQARGRLLVSSPGDDDSVNTLTAKKTGQPNRNSLSALEKVTPGEAIKSRGAIKVLTQLGLLIMFQFIGEALVASIGISFPGPLCGLLLLPGYLYLSGGPSDDLSGVGSKLVDNLGLLFVPAGTAIVAYGTLLATDGLAIFAALVISTLVAVLVSGAIAASADDPGGSMP